jgi:putative transposase
MVDAKIESVRTGSHSPWQNGICERVVGILRRELLDHIIPFDEKYLDCLLSSFKTESNFYVMLYLGPNGLFEVDTPSEKLY